MTDRDAIVECMARYGRACDTKDFALLEACFTDDAVIVYSPTFGEEIRGRPALADYLAGALTPLDGTQHLFGNFEVAVEPEAGSGRFRCYVQAQHVRNGLPDGSLLTVGGRYENEVVRGGDGTWRMTRLEFEPIWIGGNPAVLGHLMHEAELPSSQ